MVTLYSVQMIFSHPVSFAVSVACLAGLAGCASSIGDACTTNVQCSPLGDRFCDIGSPNGYCTVAGCDYQTCPDNANCVRFFTLERTPDKDCTNSTSVCQPGELCVCDTLPCVTPKATPSNPNPTKLTGLSYCASEKTERSWCMASCNQDSDCRQSEGYACYTTGTNGAEAVPYRDENNNYYVYLNPPPLNFCAPSPPPYTPGP
jgi:hypothetical protein